MKDRRPDPKPRKHPQLWQSYLWWNEVMEMRRRHNQRISSIEAGKSNLDAQIEQDIIETMSLDHILTLAKKQMVDYGSMVGPIWDWATTIRGLGAGGLAAQLLAQIDNISKFAKVSKLWRFCGWAVMEYWASPSGAIVAPKAGYKARKAKKGEWVKDGVVCSEGQGREAIYDEPVREYVVPKPKTSWHLVKHIDVCLPGWVSPYNRRLKSICWQVVDQFIKQQTPFYVDLYYAEKDRQRRLYPEKVKVNGRWKYNDGHLHHRAMRYTAKRFLQHLYTRWREFEGLPVSDPYVQAVMGHTNIVLPPRMEEQHAKERNEEKAT